MIFKKELQYQINVQSVKCNQSFNFKHSFQTKRELRDKYETQLSVIIVETRHLI